MMLRGMKLVSKQYIIKTGKDVPVTINQQLPTCILQPVTGNWYPVIHNLFNLQHLTNNLPNI